MGGLFPYMSNILYTFYSFCPRVRIRGESPEGCGKRNSIHAQENSPANTYGFIKPHCNALLKKDTLSRCLDAHTQNSNESMNALIWKMCPKMQKRYVEQFANDL